MTLGKRIIPTILVRGKTAYKGECFNSWRSIGSAMSIARTHAVRGVDEIVVLDIGATAEGRGPDLDLVRELSDGLFIPLTVGGGIRSLKDIDALLRAGADKVSVCTGAHEVPGLISTASSRFGSQAIVVSIDVRSQTNSLWARCGEKLCGYYNGETGKAYGPAYWAIKCEMDGAGEILLNSIDRDGMMQGYDLDLIRNVSSAVNIPVIASGGCGGYNNMLDAFKAGADACAAGALFSFTDCTPRGASQYLKQHGMEVRL